MVPAKPQDRAKRTVPWKATLDVAASLAMLVAAVVLLWALVRPRPDSGAPRQAGVPTEPIALQTSSFLGSPAAQVAVIVFSDFQCPYCRAFARETLPAIRSTYVETGQVRLEFRHFPLTGIHPYAWAAAEVAECARSQGKFWLVHDALFAARVPLDDSYLMAVVESSGLDLLAFELCRKSSAKASVSADSELAKTIGLKGTPVLLVGSIHTRGRVTVRAMITGSRSIGDVSREIDRIIDLQKRGGE